MLVSILVPIYKVEKYITRCLDSIFHQTYKDIEYVFVNDCTPDGSMKLLNKYIEENNIDKRKIQTVSHSENQGIAVTRNDCIANASGDYVLFVDSDDWIEPDMIEQLVLATSGGIIDIVGCDFYDNFSDGRQIANTEKYSLNSKYNLCSCLNYRIATALWKILVRRSLFEKVIFIPEIEIGEDYVASIKLYYYADSCSYVHKCLYHYAKFTENCYSNMLEKSIHNHILAVNEVKRFLHSVNFWNRDVEHELKLRKFHIKKHYLSRQLYDIDKWKVTFPDVNNMWRYVNYPLREKIKYWLAEKHLFFIIKMLKNKL